MGAVLRGSPRAFWAWPLAWPSPSGPLGWQRLRGQRRAACASRAAGCGAPLGWRGRPGQCAAFRPGGCDIRPAIGAPGARLSAWSWCWRARQRDTAGTAGGWSPGVPCAAARRAVGLASEGSGESCRPATARPPGEPGPPTAGHPGRSSLSSARARPRCSRPGPSGPARRRCALDDREENSHHTDTMADTMAAGSSESRSGCGYSGQSNRAQMVRVMWSP
jgi:hypothetical protein